jgi:hypothetical protein
MSRRSSFDCHNRRCLLADMTPQRRHPRCYPLPATAFMDERVFLAEVAQRIAKISWWRPICATEELAAIDDAPNARIGYSRKTSVFIKPH